MGLDGPRLFRDSPNMLTSVRRKGDPCEPSGCEEEEDHQKAGQKGQEVGPTRKSPARSVAVEASSSARNAKIHSIEMVWICLDGLLALLEQHGKLRVVPNDPKKT